MQPVASSGRYRASFPAASTRSMAKLCLRAKHPEIWMITRPIIPARMLLPYKNNIIKPRRVDAAGRLFRKASNNLSGCVYRICDEIMPAGEESGNMDDHTPHYFRPDASPLQEKYYQIP